MKPDLHQKLEDLLNEYSIVDIIDGLVRVHNEAQKQGIPYLHEGAKSPGKDEK